MGNSPRLTYNPGSASSSQSTMVNSSGHLVWAPHNLLEYSEDFSQWYDVDGTLDTTLHEAPDGSTTARKITVNTASTAYTREFLTIGASSHTFGVYVKAGTASTVQLYVIQQGSTSGTADIDLATGQVSNVSSAWTVAPVATSVGDGWWLVVGSRSFTAAASNHGVGVTATNQNGLTYYIWGAHLYRSDLGGMAPVPGAVGDFQYYVPTNGNAEYLPRVGHHVYNGSAWVNEGLLIESEARTNLVTESDLNDAAWGATRATKSSNAAASPDGNTNAMAVIASADNNSHFVSDVLAVTAATPYTVSVYAKAGGKDWVTIYNDLSNTYFDLSNGIVGTVPGNHDTTASIQDVGAGWYRCSITFTPPDTSYLLAIGPATADNNNAYAGDNATEEVYLWGAQLEAAPTPSSYIPTNGSTVTRGGQSLTVPPAQFGWPEPEYIGPELVVDGSGNWVGDFDVAADVNEWTLTETGTGTAEWDSGTQSLKLTRDDLSNRGTASQTVSGTSGELYLLSFDVLADSDGSVAVAINGTPFSTRFTSGQTALYTFVSDGSDLIEVLPQSNGGTTVYIDNISVREINPLAVSIQMDGRMTYADEGGYSTVVGVRWREDADNFIISLDLSTNLSDEGRVFSSQESANVYDAVSQASPGSYTPGVLVPFNIASRHGSTFINAAVDGVALTANTTPTALPDLSGTDLEIAYDFMGTIGTFRQFAGDIGDAGLVTATNPSTEPTLSLTFDGTGGSFYNLNWSE